MKVLFLSTYSGVCPHFEAGLEVLSKHVELEDDIFVLNCDGVLDICPSNLQGSFARCLICKERFKKGINCLGSSNIQVINLERKKYLYKFKSLPKIFSNIEELKSFKLNNIDFGAAVACSLISELRDHKFDPIRYRDRVNKTLKSSVLIYQNMIDLLERINPDISYIYNGSSAYDRPAVRACQKLKYVFFTYDMNMVKYALAENSLGQDLEKFKKEILQLWKEGKEKKEEKKKIGTKWFIDARGDKGFFVKDQKKGQLPENFDFSKRNMAIFNTSLDELETFPEYHTGVYSCEIEAMQQIVKSFENDSDIRFYFRVHPNLKDLNNTQMKNLKKLSAEGHKNLEIIWPEELIDSYALLEACEKTIVFFSSIGVEACFWGKPSIILGKASYEDLNCCYIPKSHREVVEMINSKLLPKSKDDVLKYGYWVLKKRIKFKKFNKDDLTYCGKKLGLENNFKNRFLFSFYSKIDQIRNKLNKFRSRV